MYYVIVCPLLVRHALCHECPESMGLGMIRELLVLRVGDNLLSCHVPSQIEFNLVSLWRTSVMTLFDVATWAVLQCS